MEKTSTTQELEYACIINNTGEAPRALLLLIRNAIDCVPGSSKLSERKRKKRTVYHSTTWRWMVDSIMSMVDSGREVELNGRALPYH